MFLQDLRQIKPEKHPALADGYRFQKRGSAKYHVFYKDKFIIEVETMTEAYQAISDHKDGNLIEVFNCPHGFDVKKMGKTEFHILFKGKLVATRKSKRACVVWMDLNKDILQ
jgi:hypothetical protein